MSDTYITMPIIVHELVDGPVPAEELDEPQALDRRSCLYRMCLPPDQLNPQVPCLKLVFHVMKMHASRAACFWVCFYRPRISPLLVAWLSHAAQCSSAFVGFVVTLTLTLCAYC